MEGSVSAVSEGLAGCEGRRRALETLHAAGDCSRARQASPLSRARRPHRSPAAPVPLEPSGSESDESVSPAWQRSYSPHPFKGDFIGGAAGGAREWRRWGARRVPVRTHDRGYAHIIRTAYPPENLVTGSKWDQLSQDIWDKFVISQQSDETFKKKMNLWRFLHLSIKSLFPRYGLYLVGSTMSGFALNSSDMDLCLHVRPLEAMDPRSHALVHLGFILNFMKSFDVLSNADLIQAKVPILKFRDSRHGIDVDLNCNNVVGIRNTNLLLAYSQWDWRVRPLVMVVKIWAQANNINDARRCTLASYSLTLMVLNYLQCGTSPAVLPCLRVTNGPGASEWEPPSQPLGPRNNQSLAELLIGFLRHYSNFQYDKMAVSIRAGRCIPVAECRAARSLKNDPHQWKLICVEEPYDLTNTARSVYDPETFEKILSVFRRSHETLSKCARLRDVIPLPTAAAQTPTKVS